MNETTRTVVLEVEGVSWASSKSIVEATLLRQPGVTRVEANPVSQTANVSYDPQLTSQAQLRQWIVDCGYHCAGQSVPEHICNPAHDPDHHDTHVRVDTTPPPVDSHHAHGDIAGTAAPEHAMVPSVPAGQGATAGMGKGVLLVRVRM